MAVTITYVGENGSAQGGKLVMSREFYNPETGDYIHIEAHETKEHGQFEVAFWVPEGNDGEHGCGGWLRHTVRMMQEYVAPAGFVEMAIPEEAE